MKKSICLQMPLEYTNEPYAIAKMQVKSHVKAIIFTVRYKLYFGDAHQLMVHMIIWFENPL
jgi:hypothetical protein